MPTSSGETGDHWTQLGPERWCYLVRRNRRQLCTPTPHVRGPDIHDLGPYRTTHAIFDDGTFQTIEDRWNDANPRECLLKEWTGMVFFSHSPAMASTSNRSTESSVSTYEPRKMLEAKDIDRSKPWDGEEPPQPLDGGVNPRCLRAT